MSIKTVELRPWSWQFKALDLYEANRITVICAGRGSGKTHMATMVIVKEAFRAPNSKIIYACQSFKLIKEVYLGLLSAPGFKNLLRTVRPYQEQPSPMINFRNGSRLTMITLGAGQDAGRSLGLEANALIVDEAREIPEQAYLDLSPCVSRLRGKTLILSTFRHKSHWFSRLYFLGQEKNGLGLASMKVPSWEGICYAGAEGMAELEKERAIRTERIFARDYLCLFCDSDKCVFRKDLIERSRIKGLKPATCSKDPTILAWDLGRRADPSAVIIGDLKGRLLHAETLRLGVDWNEQVRRIRQLADLYNSTVSVENNGSNADSVIDLIRPLLLPHTVRATPLQRHNKEDWINRLVFMLEKDPTKGGLQMPDDPMFNEPCRQMEALEYKETPSYVGYTSETHDDFVSALAQYAQSLHLGYGSPALGSWSDTQRPTRYL